MTRAEQDSSKNEFPVIDPVYFQTQSEPALYELFVNGGKNGVPGEAAQKLYALPGLAITTRENKFRIDLRHLRKILRTHYGHEVADKTPRTKRLAGQQAHYVLQKIQRP